MQWRLKRHAACRQSRLSSSLPSQERLGLSASGLTDLSRIVGVSQLISFWGSPTPPHHMVCHLYLINAGTCGPQRGELKRAPQRGPSRQAGQEDREPLPGLCLSSGHGLNQLEPQCESQRWFEVRLAVPKGASYGGCVRKGVCSLLPGRPEHKSVPACLSSH